MEYVVKLEEVDKNTKNVGNKAANIGELMKAGFPVPPGFVVTANAFEKFLRANKIESKIRNMLINVNVNDYEGLRNISEQIRNMIINATIPDYIRKEIKDGYEELSVGKEAKEVGGVALDMIKAGRGDEFVAVRPSPLLENPTSISFASQMQACLNTHGFERVFEKTKISWASLFTASAIFYRRVRRSELVSTGIVVQKMVNSEKSGVVFTSNPVKNDSSQIVIESYFGLGEPVTLGLITPDKYIIDKNTGKLLEKKTNKKLWMQVRDPISGKTVRDSVTRDKMNAETLNASELSKIFDLAKRIDSYCNGQPQSIEWCMERNRLFVVQARAMTGLDMMNLPSEEALPENKKLLVSGLSASPGIVKGNTKTILDLNELSKIKSGDILVTKSTSPEIIPVVKKVAGIITDDGGYSSSVVIREFGVPCIVGTGTATNVISDEQNIILDCSNGNVYEEIQDFSSETIEQEQPPEQLPSETQSSFETLTGLSENVTGTEMKINLSSPHIEPKIIKNIDGVGLFKMERIFAEQRKNPFSLVRENQEEIVKILVDSLENIAKVVYPKQVWYRSLDMRTDELRSLEDGEEYEEANPFIGWHGIRRSLEQPGVFNCEIEALRRLHQQGLNNISLTIPFVNNINELKKVKEMIDFPIKIGIIVENPAAALKIEDFCKEGIGFVSIGLNNLTQLTLGVDADNPKVSKLYSETDSSIIKLIRHVVDTCRKYDVDVSLCVESIEASTAETLIKIGVNSISTEPDTFEELRAIVSRMERKLLLERMRDR